MLVKLHVSWFRDFGFILILKMLAIFPCTGYLIEPAVNCMPLKHIHRYSYIKIPIDQIHKHGNSCKFLKGVVPIILIVYVNFFFWIKV